MYNNIHLSLGPFQGITDMVFRNTFKRHFGGIDKYYTPFFTGIRTDHSKSLRTDEVSPDCNDIDTLTPQILSNDAEEIVRFANQCKEMGYKEVNLNMGCPFPRVANKKHGCGLMPYPDLVNQILEAVFTHTDILFSIKCSLGHFKPDEIIPMIEVFNSYTLCELIIHPRTGKQMYTGEADVERFKTLISNIKAPLVYNGDIVSVESFNRINEEVSPVSSFMLGRGILANPFLAEEICGTDTGDRRQRLYDFVRELYNARLQQAGGSPKVIGRMKELWSYLMHSFAEPQQVWRKIKKLNGLDEYEDAVHEVFEKENLRF